MHPSTLLPSADLAMVPLVAFSSFQAVGLRRSGLFLSLPLFYPWEPKLAHLTIARYTPADSKDLERKINLIFYRELQKITYRLCDLIQRNRCPEAPFSWPTGVTKSSISQSELFLVLQGLKQQFGVPLGIHLPPLLVTSPLHPMRWLCFGSYNSLPTRPRLWNPFASSLPLLLLGNLGPIKNHLLPEDTLKLASAEPHRLQVLVSDWPLPSLPRHASKETRTDKEDGL